MPATLNYTSLVADIQSYQERPDTTFVNQIPRFVMLAEWRIATDLKVLGYLQVEQGVFVPGNNTVAKPAYWRETVSFSYNTGTSIVPLLPRSYDYARGYWPQVTGTAPPRFYSDYDFNNFLITPPPDQAYNFELMSYVRIQPLDGTTQTNWLTANAPQLLLYACLVEAQTWLKNWQAVQAWEAKYQEAMRGLNREEFRKPKDRSEIIIQEP
jgi:hypothetical protein